MMQQVPSVINSAVDLRCSLWLSHCFAYWLQCVSLLLLLCWIRWEVLEFEVVHRQSTPHQTRALSNIITYICLF
jgi:hypothetical protein